VSHVVHEENVMNHQALGQGGVAVITGAASGIGLATAKAIAGRGVKIVIADLATKDLDIAAAQVTEAVIAQGGGSDADVLAVALDVSDPLELESLRDAVLGRFGTVDFLMNNAVTRVGGATSATPEDWRRAMDVNFWGVVSRRAGLSSDTKGQEHAVDNRQYWLQAGDHQPAWECRVQHDQGGAEILHRIPPA
jgi:NAD(P)-dependent dehydrogenase (short-subunit alcohol dehydrogenase family)